jgi:hypothetical protein
MSIELIVLVKNVTAVGELAYSDPRKGSGYHFGDGTHTVLYYVSDFEGSIVLQGTLESYPGEEDWVDIAETQLIGDGSTLFNRTFFGNFVWIRAKYQLDSGSIDQIVYSI